MTPSIKVDLGGVPAKLRLYAQLSNKTEDEVVAKKSSQLAWLVYRGMRAIMPKKGSIIEERMAAIRAGSSGVLVRESVMQEIAQKYGATVQVRGRKTWLEIRRGKRVVAMSTLIDGKNLRALAVERELKLRESGRGFSAYASPRPKPYEIEGVEFAKVGDKDTMSRYGFILSAFRARIGEGVEVKYAELRWLGGAGKRNTAADTLATPRGHTVLVNAVSEVEKDLDVYIKRKLGEGISKAGLS